MHIVERGATIVGLGTGAWDDLTVQAARILQETSELYVRTSGHPALAAIREHLPNLTIHSFESAYEELSTPSEIEQRIVETLVDRVRRSGSIVFAVPGSPTAGDSGVQQLCARLQALEIPVKLVPGLSTIEPMLATVGAAGAPWLEILDAVELNLLAAANAVGEVAGHDRRLPWRAPVPTAPTLVPQLYDRTTAAGVKTWLTRYYPADYPVQLLTVQGPGVVVSDTVPLSEIDGRVDFNASTGLYIPPLAETDNVRTFAGLMQLTRTLRAPGGCPWDREQSHSTLKPHLLEEAYEVLDALDSNEPSLIAEELGDLLFQVSIHSQIAAEAGTFTVEDVIEGIMRKLIGRHPHVFGDMELASAQDVRHAWESFKQREKPKRTSVMAEIPRGLPALPQSNLMQKRAASVGFEWPGVNEVMAKVEEELAELRAEVEAAAPRDLQREEFGDILFALVSVARHLRIDPEEALRLANRKFSRRFQYVESRVQGEGKSWRELSPEQLDVYWNEAKLEPIEL